jgi:hypothetical protein
MLVMTCLMMSFLELVVAKDGVKCSTCPPCMICDQFVGCVYDNFSQCLAVGNKKGFCLNGVCDIKLAKVGNLVKPPICNTYKFKSTIIKGVEKITYTTIPGINGIDCTKPGAILEAVCINGVCTPYVPAVTIFGDATGCIGLPDGFLCDTNDIFTDGEKCIKGKCVMPDIPNSCPVV